MASVGFWVALAESGLLPLDAKSTQFTGAGNTIAGEIRPYWRKFPALMGSHTMTGIITTEGLGIKSP